ncbi:MAG TPA: hypothetical protein VFJ51_00015 [Nitrososphaeraceae archaeon]|nr:hypothetical protein [Nitrososphaeraceae archaeon]
MKTTTILATVAIVIAVSAVGSFLSMVPQHSKAQSSGCVVHNAVTCYFPEKNEHCTYVLTPSDVSRAECHLGK